MSITLWKPEPDVIIHQALGKACEEASELANILARCMIQGLDQSEPSTGKPNRKALSDEISDLDAAVQWLRELIGDEYDEERTDRKLRGFRHWQRMLEADISTPSPQTNVWGLDEATKQKLREALRFSASRSVMSAEDERRILSALDAPAPAQHVEWGDWTVDDTDTAREILNYLGYGSDASREPGADRRRDKIAAMICARIDAATAPAPEKQGEAQR